jgi:beta-lactam-binding protein with PASTA domain
MTVADAKSTLENEGFTVNVVGQIASDLQAGLVAQTSPVAGSTMYDGSTISLYTSTGLAQTTPPGQGGGGGPGPPDPTATTTKPGHGHG